AVFCPCDYCIEPQTVYNLTPNRGLLVVFLAAMEKPNAVFDSAIGIFLTHFINHLFGLRRQIQNCESRKRYRGRRWRCRSVLGHFILLRTGYYMWISKIHFM